MKWCAAAWLLLCSALAFAGEGLSDPVFDRPLSENDARREAFAELAEALRAQSRVEADFTQTKHLQALAQPLESKGRFVLEEGRFHWQVREPFAISYRYADGELVREEDGEQRAIEPADEPGLHGFFAFFSDLFQLTETRLDRHFELYFHAESEGWTLGLKPDSSRMGKMLEALVVTGEGARIDRARLSEPGGDRTELQFSYPSASE